MRHGWLPTWHEPERSGALPILPSARTLQVSAAGWSSQVARRAHNPKVRGSNPLPATKLFEACQLAGRPQTIWWPCRIWEERSDGSSPRIGGVCEATVPLPGLEVCAKRRFLSPDWTCVRSDGFSPSAVDAVVVSLGCVIHECGEPFNKSHTVHFFGVELVAHSDGVVIAWRDPVCDVYSSCLNL